VAPARFGHAGARAALSQGAGVVEGDIQAAEALDGQGDEVPGIGFRAHVACQRDGLPAFRLDLPDQAVQLGLAARAHHEPRAFGREQPCAGVSDAGTGAGDEGYLAFESLAHVLDPREKLIDSVWCPIGCFGRRRRTELPSGFGEQWARERVRGPSCSSWMESRASWPWPRPGRSARRRGGCTCPSPWSANGWPSSNRAWAPRSSTAPPAG